ncbi:Archaemetzincin-2 [Acropora cervicornis]|uniref:Archaemetzincin-2 n=1 Tax=Acropora cervicornis TaxID=6130 RepID=A0AAD9UTB0_ACRCE|nr:Archaemetzincin-2 [Acropora cervicornis]
MAVALSTSTLRDLGDIKTLPKKEKMFLTKGLKNETLFPVLPTPNEGFEVKVLPSVSIEKLGCKTRRKSGHCQLYIPDIYKYFRSHWPRDAFCVVGITMTDLYPSESFQFVFGQANYSDSIGVFSFARFFLRKQRSVFATTL